MKMLREAFNVTTKDPEFLAFAEKANLVIDFMDHEELTKVVKRITSTRPEDVEFARIFIQ